MALAASLVVLAAGCATATEEQATTAEQPDAAAEAPAGEAKIRLVERQSFCREYPGEARIYVYLTFRNTGDGAGKANALPVRRYSDGTTNDSVLDTMIDMKVPAGAKRRYHGAFDYDALAHDLIECAVKLDVGDGLGDPIPLRVAEPG